MPNGHGGTPFLGAPLLIAVMFATFAGLPQQARLQLGNAWIAICLVLAALFGWRLAYHLHMRDSDEYGGAYTPTDEYRRASRRYRVKALIYIVLALTVASGILWWRRLS
jgi:hypothetical protein